MCTCPAEAQPGDTLPCLSSNCLFLFGAIFSSFLCFLVVILLLKMASKHSAGVLPRCRRAVMCLMEKIYDT